MTSAEAECFHKIIKFQMHPNCSKLAPICDKNCQPLHLENLTVNTVMAESISSRYKQINDTIVRLITERTKILSKHL